MDRIISSFKKQFNCTLIYEKISFELGKSHAFFIEIGDPIYINDWKVMRNFIAIEFQNTLMNEFERWNLYLFYVVNSSISKDLKYQIENDTFSSRKVVIEERSNYTDLIEAHVLNTDINIKKSRENNLSCENDESKDSDQVFTPNRIFYDELAVVEVKSKVTNSLKDAHLQILKKLKEVSNENK